MIQNPNAPIDLILDKQYNHAIKTECLKQSVSISINSSYQTSAAACSGAPTCFCGVNSQKQNDDAAILHALKLWGPKRHITHTPSTLEVLQNRNNFQTQGSSAQAAAAAARSGTFAMNASCGVSTPSSKTPAEIAADTDSIASYVGYTCYDDYVKGMTKRARAIFTTGTMANTTDFTTYNAYIEYRLEQAKIRFPGQTTTHGKQPLKCGAQGLDQQNPNLKNITANNHPTPQDPSQIAVAATLADSQKQNYDDDAVILNTPKPQDRNRQITHTPSILEVLQKNNDFQTQLSPAQPAETARINTHREKIDKEDQTILITTCKGHLQTGLLTYADTRVQKFVAYAQGKSSLQGVLFMITRGSSSLLQITSWEDLSQSLLQNGADALYWQHKDLEGILTSTDPIFQNPSQIAAPTLNAVSQAIASARSYIRAPEHQKMYITMTEILRNPTLTDQKKLQDIQEIYLYHRKNGTTDENLEYLLFPSS